MFPDLLGLKESKSYEIFPHRDDNDVNKKKNNVKSRRLRRQRSHSFDDKDFLDNGNGSDGDTTTIPVIDVNNESSKESVHSSRVKSNDKEFKSFIGHQQSDSVDDINNTVDIHFVNKDKTSFSGAAFIPDGGRCNRKLTSISESNDDLAALPQLSTAQSTCTSGASLIVNQLDITSTEKKFSFVRLHTALKTFSPRNETVVVSIYFEPTVLLYEVVVVDILVEKVVSRIYVYQKEISIQMWRRKAVLKKQEKLKYFTEPYDNLQRKTNGLKSRKTTQQSKGGSAPKHRQRRVNNELDLNSKIKEWNENDSVCKFFNQNKTDSIKVNDDVEFTSDGIDNDKKDSQSLSFVTAIIDSLNSCRTGYNYRYRLMNDLTAHPFVTFSNIPESLKAELQPAPVDAHSSVSQAKKIHMLEQSTNSLKECVHLANDFAGSTVADLKRIENEETADYKQVDALNPNRIVWRLRWQFAIKVTIETNRNRKKLREEWSQLATNLLLRKRKDEEEQLSFQRNNMGYRKHKIRTRRFGLSCDGVGGGGDFPVSVEQIAQYREEMSVRRKKKKIEKGGKNNEVLSMQA